MELIVKNSRRLLALSERFFGTRFTIWILKKTFFGHFCAGTNGEDIQPTIQKLGRSGVGSILDYAAEADVGKISHAVVLPEHKQGVVSARIFEYEGEAECDANVELFLSAIDAASTQKDGFVAVKLTALGKPEFLERTSTILHEIRRLFRKVDFKAERGKDYLHRKLDFLTLVEGFKQVDPAVSKEKLEVLFKQVDKDGSGSIDFLEWVDFFNPRDLAGLNPRFQGLPQLTEKETKQYNAMLTRMEKVAERADKQKIHLMIDAEQTYLQPAIDHMVLYLQRRFNHSFPIIFNTYQCYLTDSFGRVEIDLARSQREGFLFAAKIVRGAYLVQERKRAIDMKYKSPVWDNIEETNQNYHRVLSLVLENVKSNNGAIMVASHNEKSVKYTLEQMKQLGIGRETTGPGSVAFGQLLGMCDHISFALGQHHYRAFKYVPYGPVKEVIPYLIRRAEENSNILGSVTKERGLLWNELVRRIKNLLLPGSSPK